MTTIENCDAAKPLSPIEQIPNEITDQIASYLNRSDLSNIVRCNRTLFNLYVPRIYESLALSVSYDEKSLDYVDLEPNEILLRADDFTKHVKDIQLRHLTKQIFKESDPADQKLANDTISNHFLTFLKTVGWKKLKSLCWSLPLTPPVYDYILSANNKDAKLTSLSLTLRGIGSSLEIIPIPTVRKLRLVDIESIKSITTAGKIIAGCDRISHLHLGFSAFQLFHRPPEFWEHTEEKIYSALGRFKPAYLHIESAKLVGLSPDIVSEEHLRSLTLRYCSDLETLQLESKSLKLKELHLVLQATESNLFEKVLRKLEPNSGLQTLIIGFDEGDYDEEGGGDRSYRTQWLSSIQPHLKTVQNLAILGRAFDRETDLIFVNNETSEDMTTIMEQFLNLKEISVIVSSEVLSFGASGVLSLEVETDELSQYIYRCEKLWLQLEDPEQLACLKQGYPDVVDLFDDIGTSVEEVLTEMATEKEKPSLEYLIIGSPGVCVASYSITWKFIPPRHLEPSRYEAECLRITIPEAEENRHEHFKLADATISTEEERNWSSPWPPR